MDELILLFGGIVLLLVSLLALLIYSGLFAPVNVKTGKPPIGKAVIAYKDGCGPYSGVGSTFSQSTSIAPALKQIGLYYDDPAEVAEDKLRWAVGAVLAENDEVVDETVRAAYEKEKYKFMTLPEVSNSVNCVFPYTTMISVFIAVKRVYPTLAAYVREYRLEAYPFMEVYFGGDIHFMAPLSSQMDFYTPKALESESPQSEEEKEAMLIPEPKKSVPVPATEEPVSATTDEEPIQLHKEPEPTLLPEVEAPMLQPEGKEPALLPEVLVREGKEETDSDSSFEKIEAEN